jgi:hypothetical protein
MDEKQWGKELMKERYAFEESMRTWAMKEYNRTKKMATFVMHDQQMMDLLEEHYTEEAVVVYAECLEVIDDGRIGMPTAEEAEEYMYRLNCNFKEQKIPYRAIKLLAADDDGYTWEFTTDNDVEDEE